MEAQPTPIGARDALRLTKESHEKKQHEVIVDLGLELEVAREIFRRNFTPTALELERGVERVIDFFDEDDERTNVLIAQAGTRIVLFELLDQPARIINADVKLVVGAAEKSSG